MFGKSASQNLVQSKSHNVIGPAMSLVFQQYAPGRAKGKSTFSAHQRANNKESLILSPEPSMII